MVIRRVDGVTGLVKPLFALVFTSSDVQRNPSCVVDAMLRLDVIASRFSDADG